MKKYISRTALIAVLLLSGCGGNLKDWGKQTFLQGKKQKDTSQIAKKFVKQINIYDQLNTVGLFDALWLSDQVRSFYSDRYALMTGKSEEEKMIILRRLFKSNSQYISFYVLTPFDVVLAVKPVQWSVYLEIDGKKYQPTYIKSTELPVLYQALFGQRFNAHKQPYEVRFSRYDSNENDLLIPDIAHNMRIVINSLMHLCSAEWVVSVIDPQRMLELQNELGREEHSKAPSTETLVMTPTAVVPDPFVYAPSPLGGL